MSGVRAVQRNEKSGKPAGLGRFLHGRFALLIFVSFRLQLQSRREAFNLSKTEPKISFF
ncbi:hypothetical protein [Campylobacter curvus]|uniref:hypothetical protein n=1 Tax=Campylobacter curvus TaxID=200 RepID=UPI0014704061|nr:hypothetical protein [Campylobacter curvus]